MDMSLLGYKKLCITTPDSDVVVISLYAYQKLNFDEIWVEYGSGKRTRWLPIHEYAYLLSEPVCHAFPFWHVISGCDTVSQFAGKGKKTSYKAWIRTPNATEVFCTIPYRAKVSDEDIRVIETFVINFQFDFLGIVFMSWLKLLQTIELI